MPSPQRKLAPRVHVKAKHLMEAEGKPRAQAYAIAASMHRAGRLTANADYVRKRK